jgi:hypothetical protein
MSLGDKLKHEVRSVLLTTSYFGAWFGALVGLKTLVLAEHQIELHGLTMALLGALLVAKVVLVLEHVPIGARIQRTAPWVDVVSRTGLYAAGTFVALSAERAFEARHAHGGFGKALAALVGGAEVHHLLATTICVAAALYVFNAYSALRGSLELLRIFTTPQPRVGADGRGE